MQDLEDRLLAEVEGLLTDIAERHRDRPDVQRRRLLLLALEREQIVSVAYAEDTVARRVDALAIPADAREIVRHGLRWAWTEEQLHAQYIRGLLLRTRRPTPAIVILGRQAVGAISGWVTSTRHHGTAGDSPVRNFAASVLVGTARLTGRIDPLLAAELRATTFHRYCRLNVALERTAERSYVRAVELAETEQEAATFRRIGAEEGRHARLFESFAAALDPDDRLVGEVEDLRRAVAAIGADFLPAAMRPSGGPAARTPTGAGVTAPVVLRGRGDATVPATSASASASDDRDHQAVLRQALDASGIGAVIAERGGTVAIRTAFMLGYDRRDPTSMIDPAALRAMAAWCLEQGADRVAVLEAPTVYDRYFAHRSVAEVAHHFGHDRHEGLYDIIDIGADQQAMAFERGMVRWTLSEAWRGADVRLVLAPFRTDPTEGAHLCLCTLEGTAGRVDDTVHTDRMIDFRSTTMMALEAAPADGGVVDAWGPVAVGSVGVMGCDRPAHPRRVYAGRDILALDRAVLRDLQVPDPRGGPIVRLAQQWQGLAGDDPVVRDGDMGPFGPQVRTPWRTPLVWTAAQVAQDVYANLSGRGRLFVPAMDPAAFPPLGRVDPFTRLVRTGAQQVFGLHPPGAAHPLRLALRRAGRAAAALRGVRHRGARLRSIGDSRAMVRVGFLASAERVGLLPHLPATLPELTDALHVARPDRLAAWLELGVALGELRRSGARYVVAGGLARALAAGDAVLGAHYRSVLDYQMGAFADVAGLLGSVGAAHPDGTVAADREDVHEHGGTIAAVSLGAAPFLLPLVREAALRAPRGLVLDAGCGTGAYLAAVLGAAPHLQGLGVDADADAVAMARTLLADRAVADRASVRCEEVAAALVDGPFALVLLLNSLYYTAPEDRHALLRRIAASLDEDGEVLIATLATPGGVATAQLDWLLRVQAGAMSLPSREGLHDLVTAAGLVVVEEVRPVPGEGYVVLRARRSAGTLP